MSNQVYWTLELETLQGRDAEFRALMAEMVAATQANEPGTLNYEWSTSADGKICHTFERFADSDAVMTHLGTFGEQYAARFMEVLKPTRFTVYGAPNQAVKDALAGFGAVHMESAAGFSR